MIENIVDAPSQGMKAEKYVRKYLKEAPLGFIYKAFRKKDIKVNGHWVKKDHVLNVGDVIRIYVNDQQLEDFKKPREATKVPFPYDIIYEDNDVLIVNKPSGLLVYGDKDESRNTLTNKVLNYLYYKEEFDPENHSFVPAPAHRLDRNTSGLVVFGKTDAGLKALVELFRLRKGIEKKYWALVAGRLEGEGKIEAPLKKNPESGLVSICSPENGGKTALTLFSSLERFADSSLVECLLVTGRTHQIRVHMASISHPIIGDGKYGDFGLNKIYKAEYGLSSQFLHAHEMSFGELGGALSGLSNKKFICPLPPFESALLAQLRK